MYDSTTKSFWYNNGLQWLQIGARYYVGEKYGGGIVFWVDQTGEHGLVAATADQSTYGLRWDKQDQFISTMAHGSGAGAGKLNTFLIISRQGYPDAFNIYAAVAATQFFVPNNSASLFDWYLPSRDELLLMYQARNIIGGFAADKYWSSNEYDADPSTSAWYVDFSNGEESTKLKNNFFLVRSVRSF